MTNEDTEAPMNMFIEEKDRAIRILNNTTNLGYGVIAWRELPQPFREEEQDDKNNTDND